MKPKTKKRIFALAAVLIAPGIVIAAYLGDYSRAERRKIRRKCPGLPACAGAPDVVYYNQRKLYESGPAGETPRGFPMPRFPVAGRGK